MKYPKDIYRKKKNQLTIISSLFVSIDYGHATFFPNPNLQYLHLWSFELIVRVITKAISLLFL
jgi:hypothetical protein